jgi:hypothetical protein
MIDEAVREAMEEIPAARTSKPSSNLGVGKYCIRRTFKLGHNGKSEL